MKFLITGGLGFIGHNVVRILESWGHDCQIIDNQTNYDFIPKEELNYLLARRVQGIRGTVRSIDIRHHSALTLPFELYEPDVVVHLASYPRQKVVNVNPRAGAEVMVNGLINLLELARQNKTKRFVYVSSSMVYGDFENNVTEDALCRPVGLYGILKLTGEHIVKDYQQHGFFDYTIIRPSAVYGEWDVEDRVVSKFITRAMRGETLKVKGAEEVLDFTYVMDAAMGIALAATKDVAANKTYNITRSDDKLYTLLDAANLAVNVAGQGSVEIEGRDLSFPKRGRLDITRAVNELGYNPQVNVEEGFRRYHEWYLQNPILWSR